MHLNALYSGFDLCAPKASVSMTINGPVPIVPAMYFNAAIDQQMGKFSAENGSAPTEVEAEKESEWVLAAARGTVQADIFKNDQVQNAGIFSTEFALELMGDMQV